MRRRDLKRLKGSGMRSAEDLNIYDSSMLASLEKKKSAFVKVLGNEEAQFSAQKEYVVGLVTRALHPGFSDPKDFRGLIKKWAVGRVVRLRKKK